MPLHDYRCPYGHVSEHFVKAGTNVVACTECEADAKLVFLVSAKPNWLALAQGQNASPEAIDKFEKMHKQQAAKESKSMQENGDYGPRPGAD